jgi:hypothetical protein
MLKPVGDAAAAQLLAADALDFWLACTIAVAALLMHVHQLANLLLFANQHANLIHVDAASQVFWLAYAPKWPPRRAADALLLAKPHVNLLANQLQLLAANQLQRLAANQLQLLAAKQPQLAAKMHVHQAARRVFWLA